jgi:hypothetical protein
MQGDSNVSEFNIFYIAGIGCSDSGEGSAYAWVDSRTKRTHKEEVLGLTTKAATYEALSSVVGYLLPGSEAFVFTHSLFLRRDIKRPRYDHEIIFPTVAEITRQMINLKKLTIHVEKVRRSRNPAWKLLAASRGIALADGSGKGVKV